MIIRCPLCRYESSTEDCPHYRVSIGTLHERPILYSANKKFHNHRCSPGGIGNALAREFHSKGLRVFATARKTETISDLSDLGIEALSLEVHKPESIKTLKSVVEERSGGTLDFLVNNAGRNYTVPGLDVDFEEVIDLFNVNVFAVMRMCQEFAPLLIRAKGVIIQIGSLSGIM